MAKLNDYSFKGLPKPVQNFKDEVYSILNYGKVAHPVVGAIPAWNTYEGEMAFFHNTAASPSERIYVRLNSAWVFFAGANSNGPMVGGTAGGPEYAIQSNSSSAFYGDSKLLWYRGTGAALAYDFKLIFNNSLSTQTYMIYNSAAAYHETYVDGEIRLQM